MLEFFRKHVGGLMGFLLVGALVVTFALSFGTQSQGWGKGADGSAALSVEGEEISNSVLRYAINMTSRTEVSQESAEFKELQRAAALGLVERQVLLNLAEKSGISASTDEAMDSILKGEFYISHPVARMLEELSFQIQFGRIPMSLLTAVLVKDGHRVMLGDFKGADGRFDVENFNKVIRYRVQAKEEDFVEQQRLELIALRMRQLLVTGISVSDREIREAYDRENNSATLSYLKISPAQFQGRTPSTSEALSAWKQANGKAVSDYYENNKYKYTGVEKSARARHILVKVEANATDEAKAEARKKAEALLVRAKNGEDFAALAQENSDDPGSRVKGGDLGFNPHGVMVPVFDEVMFSLSPGAISDVVETEFGFHIISLIAFREGDVSLEDATNEIAEQLFAESSGKEMAEKAANEYLQSLQSGVGIDNLIPAGSQDGLPENQQLRVQTSSAFPRNVKSIPGIGESSEMVEAAFALTMEKPASNKLFRLNDSYYLVSLKSRDLPTDEGFQLKKAEIAEKLLAMKQATWLSDRIESMVAAVMKAGKVESTIPLVSASAAPMAPVAPAKPPTPPAPSEDKEDDGE